MRSFLHLALALVALVVAVSAALDEFPKRTRTAQGPVDLDVKRVLRSRQLTREQLVARAKVRATRTGPKPRAISDTSAGSPFTIKNSAGNPYRLDDVNGLVTTAGPQTQFRTSGSAYGTVTTTAGSAPLSFVPNGNPNSLMAGGPGTTPISCSTATLAPAPPTNRYFLTCFYTPSGSPTPAPVYFCTRGSSTVLASTAPCRTTGMNPYSPLVLYAQF